VTAEEEFLTDLDLAELWLEQDVRSASDPDRARQLRYSLCNKLAADWQKYVKARCRSVGVDVTSLRNCWPPQVQSAFLKAGRSDPFIGIDSSAVAIFDHLNPVRNAIDHGDEPATPTVDDLESWIRNLRTIAHAGLGS
jgi:hypothetical protein